MFNYKLLLLVGLVGVAAHFQHEGKKGGSHEGPKGPGGKHGPSGPHGGPKGGSHEGPKKGPGGPGRHGPPKSEKDGSGKSSTITVPHSINLLPNIFTYGHNNLFQIPPLPKARKTAHTLTHVILAHTLHFHSITLTQLDHPHLHHHSSTAAVMESAVVRVC